MALTELRFKGVAKLAEIMKHSCRFNLPYEDRKDERLLERMSEDLYGYCPISELYRISRWSYTKDLNVLALVDDSGLLCAFTIFEVMNQNGVNHIIMDGFDREDFDDLPVRQVGEFLVLQHMVVVPSLRGKGIGTLLLSLISDLGLSIVLDSTYDSEDFWKSKGYRHLEETSWLACPRYHLTEIKRVQGV